MGSPIDFLSWYWWVSVVVVSVIINLISAYLKPPLDNLLASMSSRWMIRLKRNKTAYEQKVQRYLDNPPLITILGMNSTYNWQVAMYLAMGVFMFILIDKHTDIALVKADLALRLPFISFAFFRNLLLAVFFGSAIAAGVMCITAVAQHTFLTVLRFRLLKRINETQGGTLSLSDN